MNSFEYLKYFQLGIALSIPSATMSGYEFRQLETDAVPFFVEQPYSQETTQLNLNLYNLVVQPRRNFHQLYSEIGQSSWFSASYKGKSLGDFIEVEL